MKRKGGFNLHPFPFYAALWLLPQITKLLLISGCYAAFMTPAPRLPPNKAHHQPDEAHNEDREAGGLRDLSNLRGPERNLCNCA
jgi:hypothetical protein